MVVTQYIFIAAGALLAVLAVLLLCLKKLPLSWGISFLVCGLILGSVGGLWLRYEKEKKTEAYGCVYMALRYLEEERTDPAALYLQRAGLEDDYHLLSAQILLEQLRGNTTMARVRLDVLKKDEDLTLDQEDGVAVLRAWSPDKERSTKKAVNLLVEQLPLTQEELDLFDQKFEQETGFYDKDWEEDFEGDEIELLRLQINQAVGLQDWREALERAVELVHLSPTQSDRLLLASVVAELTYFDSKMSTRQFAAYEKSSGEDTQAEEKQELTKEYERLQRKLESLQMDLEDVEGEEASDLMEQEKELKAQVEEAQMRAENIFAYRALNAIADIHTLKAQVVRAKLYFAIRNYQQAIDTLCQTADSLQATLSRDKGLVDSLKNVQSAYERGAGAGVDSEAFRSEMQMLMGSVHPELINFSATPLSQAFAERIADDQVQYGDGLYIMDLDETQYPQITVRLGGQDSVIEHIAEKDTITVTDTRKNLTTYQVTYAKGIEAMNSICFVVDVSGSMSGRPLEDAKEALDTFLDNTDDYTEMALVAFESYANTLVGLTTSTSRIQDGVDSLVDGGGTSIGAGIQEGTRALAESRGVRTMILMTDGQSDINLDVVQEVIENDVTIFTVGFGDVNDELLMQIAELTGGQYLYAEDSTELVSIYTSLRKVIGNTVTLTYTVEDPATENRYFYLYDGKSGISVREDYFLAVEKAPVEETENTETAAVTTYQPILQRRDELESMVERQQAYFAVGLSGNHLDQVVSAYIGGTPCIITRSNSTYLQLDIPTSLSGGVYDLTLTAQDGTMLKLSKMLWIGDDVSYRSYHAGDLQFTANEALLLPDQTLVLGGTIRMTDVQINETRVNTLSVDLNGVLAFPSVRMPGETEDVDPNLLYIGEAGTATAVGALQISQYDKAYDRNTDRTLFNGEMTLQYSTEKSVIVPSEVNQP